MPTDSRAPGTPHFAATGVLVLTSHTGDAGKIGEEWRYRLKDEVEMIVSPDWEI